MKIIICCLIVTLIHTFTAVNCSFAAVYRWQDSRGGVHFTDNPGSIPPEYRKKSVNIDSMESGAPHAADSSPPVQIEPDTDKGRTYWSNRYKALRTEMNGLKGGLSSKKEQAYEHRRKWMVTQSRSERQNMNRVMDDITRDEERISDLEKQLESLDVEAAKNSVPLEWRK